MRLILSQLLFQKDICDKYKLSTPFVLVRALVKQIVMLFWLIFFVFSFFLKYVAQQNDGEFATKQDLLVLQSKIQSLETSSQEHMTLIQSLEAELKAKQDLTPLISFRAGFLHDPSPITYSNGEVVIFDAVHINDGNAYTAHSGMFRAPVRGLYIFTLHALPSSSEMEFSISKEGKSMAMLVSTNSGTESIQTVIHLKAGQEVWIVKHWGGNTLRGLEWSTFSGFLLRIDDANFSLPNGGSAVVG